MEGVHAGTAGIKVIPRQGAVGMVKEARRVVEVGIARVAMAMGEEMGMNNRIGRGASRVLGEVRGDEVEAVVVLEVGEGLGGGDDDGRIMNGGYDSDTHDAA